MEEVPIQEDYGVEPVITEKKVWNERNIIFALILTILLIAVEFISVLLLDLTPLEASLLGFLLIFLYAVVLFFLVEPTLVREVRSAEVRTVGPREIIRTVERPIVRTVERPVIQEKIIRKNIPIYLKKSKKKLKIPHYTYLGSTESKTYHKRSCRFGKLIKRKYKLSSNDENYFKKRKFEPCKVCLKKESKKSEKKNKGKVKKKTVKFTAKVPAKKTEKKAVKKSGEKIKTKVVKFKAKK